MNRRIAVAVIVGSLAIASAALWVAGSRTASTAPAAPVQTAGAPAPAARTAGPGSGPGGAPGSASPSRPAAPLVPIEDGKSIDFSSGKAVVRDTPEAHRSIDAAVREIDEASATVVFEAPKSQGATAKP